MPLPLTPVRFLHRAADLFGPHVGVVSGDKSYTYSELAERCERLASALTRLGVRKGDRVAFLSFNTNQLLEGYYGVPMIGAVVMPLNVRLSEQELADILNHAEARILFYESDFEALTSRLRTRCSTVQTWRHLGSEYEQLLASAEPNRLAVDEIDEHSMAELFYTSGSTGTPKGVMLTHRTLYLHALNVADLYPPATEMVDLHTIPLFHANGWGRPQASTMLGIKQVMVRRFEPGAVLSLIEQHRATDMSLVPTMANALLNFPDFAKYDVSSMQRIMIGGAAASAELIERMEKAFQCECWGGYGLTETCPVLTCGRPKYKSQETGRARYVRQAKAGWPVLGVELAVVDHEDRPVPKDDATIGEVVARGDHIMAGYYKDEAATAAVMRNGWFHTGDMAVWDAETYIHIVDRKKEIIISGGENISSIEVERAIYSHPAVFECAVVPAPDERWGEVPVAIVVLKEGQSLSEEELLKSLEGRLGRFKMPRKVEFTTEPLPKTGTGKIRKLELKARYWAGRERRVQG